LIGDVALPVAGAQVMFDQLLNVLAVGDDLRQHIGG
jgi:hypothetical protein